MINAVTLARIPAAVLFALYISAERTQSTLLVGGCLLLALIEISDLLDGTLARRWGRVSEFGAMLDPLADSISRLIVYWSLAAQDLVLFAVPLVMALRDIIVAYARILLTRHHRTVSARLSGKIKAGVQAVGAFLALLGPVYWEILGRWSYTILSWTVIAVTSVSVLEYVRDALKAAREDGEGRIP